MNATPMTSARRFVSAARSARRMIADGRGAVAIEFAFILPLMLTMMGMCIILGEALAIGQKVTATARTVTDLVSQNGQLSTTQLTTILDAAAYTMAPYPSANLSIVVSEIQTDGTGKATVTWSSAAFNGVQQAQGTVVLPVRHGGRQRDLHLRLRQLRLHAAGHQHRDGRAHAGGFLLLQPARVGDGELSLSGLRPPA